MRKVLFFTLLSLAGLALTACAMESNEEMAPNSRQQALNETCEVSQCGPPLTSPKILCADGVYAGNTGNCLRTQTGTCEWEVTECGPMLDVAQGFDGCSFDEGDCEFPTDWPMKFCDGIIVHPIPTCQTEAKFKPCFFKWVWPDWCSSPNM